MAVKQAEPAKQTAGSDERLSRLRAEMVRAFGQEGKRSTRKTVKLIV